MSKKKQAVTFAVAFLTITIAFIVALIWGTDDRVNKRTFDRIHKGMTKATVLTLLGPQEMHNHNAASYRWVATDAYIFVRFDRDIVRETEWVEVSVHHRRKPFLRRLCDLLEIDW